MTLKPEGKKSQRKQTRPIQSKMLHKPKFKTPMKKDDGIIKSTDETFYHGTSKSILKKARIERLECLDVFDVVVGTTAKLGTDYNIRRTPLFPEQLSHHEQADL